MQGNAIRNIAIGAVVLVLVASAGWWYTQRQSYALPLAAGDTVTSWSFQGAATGNSGLEQKARNEIKRLESELGGDQSGLNNDPTDYSLYVSIASQYESLGDGSSARKYYEKALAIDALHTGLAWNNLGNLMARLGAKNTARIAYAKAVEAQPQVIGYHLTRLQYLMDNFASDVGIIDAAFKEAASYKNNGDIVVDTGKSDDPLASDPSILQLQAEWYEKTNRNEQAIAALEKMKSFMPKDAQSSIDAEIARLKNK